MVRHLAAIMDGNRRWALQNKLSLASGYSQGGMKALQTLMKFCLERGISYLSLYAFSLENFYRSAAEKEMVFSILLQETHKQRDMMCKESISIRFVGKLELLPDDVRKACTELEEATAQGTRLHIAILLCYGAQQEIVHAIQKMVQNKMISENASEQEIKEAFEKSLWTYPFPAPDLIMRTGKVQRLSNFLLYQSAYSEIVFLDILWPDLTHKECQDAYDFFISTKRNFGR